MLRRRWHKPAPRRDKLNKGKLLREAVGDDNFVNPVLAAALSGCQRLEGRNWAKRLSQNEKNAA
jgi:hypothetical protein